MERLQRVAGPVDFSNDPTNLCDTSVIASTCGHDDQRPESGACAARSIQDHCFDKDDNAGDQLHTQTSTRCQSRLSDIAPLTELHEFVNTYKFCGRTYEHAPSQACKKSDSIHHVVSGAV